MTEEELKILDNEKYDSDVTPLSYKIIAYPADYTLEVLHKKLQKKDISIPKFQRSYVWSVSQASRLIDSFIMGLPIPPVYLYVQNDQTEIIIDGRQRLETIKKFFNNKLTLKGINKKSHIYGKKFAELTDIDKKKLKNCVLRSILIQQVDPKGEQSSIYHIFERLNTGGTTLTDQEVRNCIYNGKLNTLLVELNEYSVWRKFLGKENVDKRQRDVQLILRYMALFHKETYYKKPMKDFLSEFMKENQNANDEFIKNERKRFKKTCRIIFEETGQMLIGKGGLNPSVFDSVFIAVARNVDNHYENIQNNMKKLLKNKMFKKHTSKATTDFKSVQKRIQLANSILFHQEVLSR